MREQAGWSGDRRRVAARAAVLAAALVAAGLLAGTVAVPLLEQAGVGAARLVRLAYAPLCHQNPERSFAIGGSAQAVCARCSGLYLGGAAALLVAGFGLFPRSARPRAVWLGLLAMPNVVDALCAAAGLPSLPNLPRLVVAAPFGFVAGRFLAVAIEEIAARPLAARRGSPAASAPGPGSRSAPRTGFGSPGQPAGAPPARAE